MLTTQSSVPNPRQRGHRPLISNARLILKMTILYSFASKERIIMAADSAKVREYTSGEREYHVCTKSYQYKKIGCLCTWGVRDHNEINDFVYPKLNSEINNVDELADVVDDYLRNHYKAKENNLDDVGYHVAGFNSDKECRLYHIFWGFDRPRPQDQKERKYEKYDHSPPDGKVFFLFNGRNELAEVVIKNFWAELQNYKSSRYDIKNPVDLVKFSDLVTRFCSEITKDVAPPFYYYLISPENEIELIKNESMTPLKENEIKEKLRKINLLNCA